MVSPLVKSAYPYLALKAAQKLFGKSPEALLPEELARVQTLADKQGALEARILSTPEAHSVLVPDASVRAAFNEVLQRYPDADEFLSDLARNGLAESDFASALERELRVDAIMQKIASAADKVTDTDVDLYYQYHPEQFMKPEVRSARHILITINESIPENTRPQARTRIDAILAQLRSSPDSFEQLALSHSECPTALDGGKLGDVTPGKLFPELDRALFAMPVGGISDVLESELGFHILRCDAVAPAYCIDLEQARPKIRNLLIKRRRHAVQQAWVKSLMQADRSGL